MVGDRSTTSEGAAEHGINTVVVDWGYGGTDFDGATPQRRAPGGDDRERAKLLGGPRGVLERSDRAPARDVRLLGQHLPVSDGRKMLAHQIQRARPGRGGAA